MQKTILQKLRNFMKEKKVDAYWVPSTDPHQSEYLPQHWNRRSFLSGFTGSAGDVLVTHDKAYLWTDSRYFLQAEEQLKNTGIELMKMGHPDYPSFHNFLEGQLDGTLALDPRLVSPGEGRKLEKLIGKDKLVYLEDNLVDPLWDNRPGMPDSTIEVHPHNFSGQTISQKLGEVRSKMREKKVSFHVLSQLDAIAWLFNIRGRDVEFNPLVVSYAVISLDEAWIFVNREKITSKVEEHFEGLVQISEYDDFGPFLNQQIKGGKTLLDSEFSSVWITQQIKQSQWVLGDSPVTRLKAIKNTTELQGFANAHIRDGVAMVRFLHWLEQEVPKGHLTEISAADQLEKFRAQQTDFQGPSFDTISGYADHGAIVHYSATKESDAGLKPEGIYLVDSGGQYLDGTTDITRTVTLGTPTDEQKDRFTRVLKGHLTLKLTQFPKGTFGTQLDTLARKSLWDAGLNYGHGTGHGVGSYLCVHEGPQAISYYRGAGVPMEPGMVVSNEPGYYKSGEYGIRIENLIFVKEVEPGNPNSFLGFENLTMCPIEKKLIDPNLLSPEERGELNRYHSQVFETLSPFLNVAESNWLEKATAAI